MHTSIPHTYIQPRYDLPQLTVRLSPGRRTSAMAPADQSAIAHDANDVLRRLCATRANRTCFDCSRPGATWASARFGVFVCLDCSGAHRRLGTHITFVRSAGMDTWSVHDLASMTCGGNDKARVFYKSHGWPTGGADGFVADRYTGRVGVAYKAALERDVAAYMADPVRAPATSHLDADTAPAASTAPAPAPAPPQVPSPAPASESTPAPRAAPSPIVIAAPVAADGASITGRPAPRRPARGGGLGARKRVSSAAPAVCGAPNNDDGAASSSTAVDWSNIGSSNVVPAPVLPPASRPAVSISSPIPAHASSSMSSADYNARFAGKKSISSSDFLPQGQQQQSHQINQHQFSSASSGNSISNVLSNGKSFMSCGNGGVGGINMNGRPSRRRDEPEDVFDMLSKGLGAAVDELATTIEQGLEALNK
jgi:ADP-ribosylation factor GTPase-activating protein 2/3